MLNYSQAGCIITLELQRVAVTSADGMMSLVANVVRPVGRPIRHILMRYYRSESARSQVGAVFSFRTYAGTRLDRADAHSIIAVDDNEILREKMRLFAPVDGADMLKSA